MFLLQELLVVGITLEKSRVASTFNYLGVSSTSHFTTI